MTERAPPDAAGTLQEAQEKHAKLASNMHKLKARHKAALREIAFLRRRLQRPSPTPPSLMS